MGNRDQTTLKSDSGYGDDFRSVASHDGTDAHPLSRKGYDIGPASNLKVGDVFEFLWADAAEFEWEWKCLGYTRFIVLRHTDNFPHHAACIPISSGSKNDFAKPGIDHHQQGFVFSNSDPNPGYEQPDGGPKLPYSPVGIELRPGRLRVKDDSRANYADIVEVDHDAQVMTVGNVITYFDRVRRNVNRAAMRQTLRRALEEYRTRQAAADGAGPLQQGEGERKLGTGIVPSEIGPSASGRVREGSIGSAEGDYEFAGPSAGTGPVNDFAVMDASDDKDDRSVASEQMARSGGRKKSEIPRSEASRRESRASRRESRSSARRESRPEREALVPPAPASTIDYDLRSMHNVAMAGLK